MWCRVNNLFLDTSKTKTLIVDFRRKKTDIQLLLIGGTCVERPSNFRFLGVNIMEDLTWSVHTTELVKKAQQKLYFLRVLRRNNIPQKLLVSFYCYTVESILSYCLCVVFKLHCASEEEAPGCHNGSTETHWLPSPLSGQSSQSLLPQEGQNHPTGLITPRSHTVQTAAVRQEIQVHGN